MYNVLYYLEHPGVYIPIEWLERPPHGNKFKYTSQCKPCTVLYNEHLTCQLKTRNHTAEIVHYFKVPIYSLFKVPIYIYSTLHYCKV